MTSDRLHQLDYLRGSAALGIMVYHYFSWWVGAFEPSSPMGRVGLYGVSIFYVLSGMTLTHVYGDRLRSVRELLSFLIKRVFRIFPLLWVVTITALLIVGRVPDRSDLVLNLTGLFGFIKWGTYFSAGIWSIGNELVFYSIFPILIACMALGWKTFIVAGGLVGVAYVVMATWVLRPELTVAAQWNSYINPANQVGLFAAGIALGGLFRRWRADSRYALAALTIGLILFVGWPVGEASSSIIVGTDRIAMSLIVVLICAAIYHLPAIRLQSVHRPLALLGESSYSVYLIHPLVYNAILLTPLASARRALLMPGAVVVTLLLAVLCFRYFERPFMALGRRAASWTPPHAWHRRRSIDGGRRQGTP